MRLLLFLVSAFFSFIFYEFYLLSNWKDFFWTFEWKLLEINSISWNCLIESIVFLLLWVFFIVAFTPLDKNQKGIDKEILYHSLFYVFLLVPIYFWLFNFWKLVLSIVIIFVFWDISFNIISNIKNLKEQKLKIRYFWLGLNYFSLFASFLYLFSFWNSYYLVLICLYSIVFNYYIYKKYSNYISLWVLILSSFLLFIHFFLIIKKIYIYFINYT